MYEAADVRGGKPPMPAVGDRMHSPIPPDPAPTGASRFLSGLVGRDIAGSRSPWLHEQEADKQGVRLIYTLFDFAARGWDEDDLPRMLDAARTIGMAGFNVTFPYKQAILPLLDDLSDGARRIGAVNTVALSGGRAIGHNTDVIGFAEGMRAGLPGVALGRVVQMGAGGAGFATAQALLELGTQTLTIFDTDAVRCAALVDRLVVGFGPGRASVGTDLDAALARADGIVNATPLGMAKYPGSAVPLDRLRPEQWVSDIVYFPIETALLSAARARGCRTLNGSYMVVFQAAAAFELITGRPADRGRMLASFHGSIGAAS
jgi:shikimate dehydrogenase